MPELNPCPICSSLSVGLCPGEDEITHEIYNQAFCTSCGVSGPRVFADEISAIAAWNSMPSALTWTTEPPKVAGWYWCMDIDKSEGYPIISYYDDWAISTVLPKINQGKVRFEWAGPIPTPLEPGES